MLINVDKKHEKMLVNMLQRLSETDDKEVEKALIVLRLKGEGGFVYNYMNCCCYDLFAMSGFIQHIATEDIIETKHPEVFLDKNNYEESEDCEDGQEH
jgi:hypothetical protein